MGRVFVTGDKHGIYDELLYKLEKIGTTKDDIVIILGDHGTLYYGAKDDKRKKRYLESLPATFILLRGNHDIRASHEEYGHALQYIAKEEYEGTFYVDKDYPSILYTTEYGWYRFGTKKVFIICGAYSADKYRRLEMTCLGFKNYHWFEDEQLSAQERQLATDELLFNEPNVEFYIMSHTCPFSYRQLDRALPSVHQSKIDNAMEIWMDHLEAQVQYTKWYCGHWHVDRLVNRVRFMYNDIELLEEVANERLSQ